jgi:hypothetical protein
MLGVSATLLTVMAELKSIHSEIYKNKKENGTTKRNI